MRSIPATVAFCLLALSVLGDGPRPGPGTDRPLLAHWTFDEKEGAICRDRAGGLDAAPEPGRPLGGLARAPGVLGGAVELRGPHALRTRGIPRQELDRLSFSAWTQPVRMGRYMEIYRQEGPHRLLFSFQEHGTILSLGLDVGGYVECDGPIEPAVLLDGGWHHCAATFDGRVMRVFFDGNPVAELARPGKVRLQPEVPAYVGSLEGGSEHFEGLLDDLRIYGEALSAEEVAALYQGGARAVDEHARLADKDAGAVYVRGGSFAEALAMTRHKLAGLPDEAARRALGRLLTRLKADYPGDYEEFLRRTGTSPRECLDRDGAALLREKAGRLVELLLEYRPVTEGQKARLTAAERAGWEEAEQVARRLAGEEVGSAGWVQAMLAAGRRVQPRPQVYEAVAPYVPPATPETRARTAAEARAAIEQDWLFQAAGKPTIARTRQEIAWARELAARLQSAHPGQLTFDRELAELDALERQAAAAQGEDRPLYFRVRELKRRIAFRNPAARVGPLLLVDMPYPQGSEWRHETRHRLGYMAVPGGRLLVLDALAPDAPVRQLMPQPPLHGSFWRPDISWDGTRVLFCFKPHNEKSFHLYEIGADGAGLRQLTDGPYDDLDPIYLPDGHILFSTTRGHSYVRCMPPTNAFVLARCDPDGKNVYLVSHNNEPDYLPAVLPDGRVVYTRWEYTDKPVWRMQKLWTVNPDGTGVSTLWGNQSVWPDLMKDARPVPNSPRILFTGSAHHDWFSGSVGLIDPRRGFNFPDGLTKVTADVPWPECGNGPVDPVESPRYHPSGAYRAYYSPYPLGEQDFLVSAERDGKFRLYLMDTDGNRELVYEGVHNVLHALPLGPRPRPPVLADRVAWPSRAERDHPKPGVIFSSNVYYGAPAEVQGKAKYLRVLHIDPKNYTLWYKRPYVSTGPVVSAVQSEGVKRILGTVPVEADGSVCFHAPAGQALHFQLLDEQQRALHTMRSFTGVMPGEQRGCLGCHESHSKSPQVRPAGALALAQPPREIAPPPWGEDTVSYPRYVQPVLDRYCGKCHQGDGEARKVLDLTLRPSEPVFPEPYHTLLGRPTWGQPYMRPAQPPPGFGLAGVMIVEGYGQVDPKAYGTQRPLEGLSSRSRLVELASSGEHYGVKVDAESLLRLILWVDALGPYQGDPEIRQMDDPDFPGVDWLAVRPRIKTAPRIVRPGPVD